MAGKSGMPFAGESLGDPGQGRSNLEPITPVSVRRHEVRPAEGGVGGR